jgi:hypothetical protein
MNTKHFYRFSTLALAFALFLTSCSKTTPDPTNSGSGSGTNGSGGNGSGNNGPTNTSLVYVNDTYTPINITVNGATSSIPAGQSVTFKGAAGSANTGTATTSGVTSTNTTVGLVMSWAINDVFPSSGSANKTLDVGANYFFLKITNQSSYAVNGVYVNYGLVAQTLDNITFGSGTYNVGYYAAYSNSNVRCISNSGVYWQSNVTLSNTENQSFLFTLTN